MGITFGMGSGQTDPLQQPVHAVANLIFVGEQPVGEDRFGDGVTDLLSRVEGGKGVLKNILDFPS